MGGESGIRRSRHENRPVRRPTHRSEGRALPDRSASVDLAAAARETADRRRRTGTSRVGETRSEPERARQRRIRRILYLTRTSTITFQSPMCSSALPSIFPASGPRHRAIHSSRRCSRRSRWSQAASAGFRMPSFTSAPGCSLTSARRTRSRERSSGCCPATRFADAMKEAGYHHAAHNFSRFVSARKEDAVYRSISGKPT